MEFLLWAFIFLIIFLVFRALKLEETSISYQQKDLINRYIDIKKINSDYRLKHLRDWEQDVELFAKQNSQKTELKVISLESHRVTK
jgi:hypothetical protein